MGRKNYTKIKNQQLDHWKMNKTNKIHKKRIKGPLEDPATLHPVSRRARVEENAMVQRDLVDLAFPTYRRDNLSGWIAETCGVLHMYVK